MANGIEVRLKQSRINAGYETATAVSDKLGMEFATYHRHENGKRNPGVEDCKVYARLFGVNPAWLMFGDEFVSVNGDPVTVPPAAASPIGADDVTVASVELKGKFLRLVKSRGLRPEDEVPLLNALIDIVRPK